MKMYKNIIGILLVFISISFSSCTEATIESREASINIPKIDNQSEAIVNFFSNNGDYINGVHSPYLISVDEVKDNLNNYLLIDTRYHEDYVKGHVDGAINVDREKIIGFLKSINIYQYEKIIIIDNTGQGAAYVASILRAIGYGSVFPMKYGMSAWNKEFANHWVNNVGDRPSSIVTKKVYKKAKKGKLPQINTKGITISEILELRANQEINYNFSITIDNLIPNMDDYYIINYWPKSAYEQAHLKGARWYQPKKSININTDLTTIPANKKVLVYCYTGQNSSAVVGYLRLLGYDAYSLRFGSNSFMHQAAIKNGWHGYIAKDKVNNFPLVVGESPSKKKKAKANTIKNPDLNFKHREVVQPDPSEVCD
jgi:rhodanese-related sulfurtransferase